MLISVLFFSPSGGRSLSWKFERPSEAMASLAEPLEQWEAAMQEKAYARGQSFRLARLLLNYGSAEHTGTITPTGLVHALDAMSVQIPSDEHLQRAFQRCPGSPSHAKDGTPLADCHTLASRILYYGQMNYDQNELRTATASSRNQQASTGNALHEAVEGWEKAVLEKAYARGQSFRLVRFLLNYATAEYPGMIDRLGLERALTSLSVQIPPSDALDRIIQNCPGTPPRAHDGTLLGNCRALASHILSADTPSFGQSHGPTGGSRVETGPPQAPKSVLQPGELEKTLLRKLNERASQPRSAFRRLFPEKVLSESSLRSGCRSLNIEPSDADLAALVEHHGESRKSLETSLFQFEQGGRQQQEHQGNAAGLHGAVEPDMERAMPAPQAFAALREKLSALASVERGGHHILREAFKSHDEDLAGSLTQTQFRSLLSHFNMRLDNTSFDLLWTRVAGSGSRVNINQLVDALFPDVKTHDQASSAPSNPSATAAAHEETKQWAGKSIDELNEPVRSNVTPVENDYEGGPHREAGGPTYRISERATLTPSLSATATERILRQKATEAEENGASSVRAFIRRFDRRASGSVDLQAFTGGLRELNILPNENVVEEVFLRLGADELTQLIRTESLLAELCSAYVGELERHRHEHEQQEQLEQSKRSETSATRGGSQRYSVQRFEAVMRSSVEGWSNGNKKLRRLFSEHDGDRDGKLTEHELQAALWRLHIDPHRDDLHRIGSAYAVCDVATSDEQDHVLVDYGRLTDRIVPDEKPHEWQMENSRPSSGWSALQHRMGPEGLERRLRELVEFDTNPRWRLRKLMRRHAYSDPSCSSLSASEFASFLMDLNCFPEKEALDRLLHAYRLESDPNCVDMHKLLERVMLQLA